MKAITTAMRGYLNGSVTSLAACWKILRTDGLAFYFTDHDADLLYQGNTYVSSGSFERTAVSGSASMEIDNVDVTGYFEGGGLLENEIRAGLFDHAQVWLFLVNWADLTMGQINLRRGWMGNTVLTKQGFYRAELRGMFQTLSQNVGEVYSYNCRADLGDSRCKVQLLPPVLGRGGTPSVGDAFRIVPNGQSNVDENGRPNSTVYGDRMFVCTAAGTVAATQPVYDFTVGNTTTDGTAQFICQESWGRTAIVVAPDATARLATSVSFPNGRDSRSVGLDNYYAGGLLTWETGSNYPASTEIKQDSASLNVLDLYLATAFPMQPGDRCILTPGCQRTPQMCSSIYNNILNYRGEPFTPGLDALVNTPDAST